MRMEPSAPHKPSRLYVLAGFLFAVLFCYVGLLYNAQVLHYDEYQEQSQRSITKSEKVVASRGILTDRNGKVLVSNRLAYTLVLDKSTFGKDQSALNDAIWRLIQLCQAQGVAWNDTLPMTTGNAPRLTTASRSEAFKTYLADNKIPANTSDEELFSALRKLYKLDESYTDAQARLIIGVRYELSGRSSYTFAEDVSTDLLSRITDGHYAGVTIKTASARVYNTKLACHILGTVGAIWQEEWSSDEATGYVGYADKGYNMNDVLGISGLESAYEDELRGKDGVETITRNSDGVIVNTQLTTVPEPGHTVQLTINSDFQRAVNKALANNIDMINRTYNTGNMKAAAGAAVVIDVKNGGVLAASNYPSFDQNLYATQYDEYSADPSLPLFNRSLQGLYTPGSTFKPAVAVAALDSGLINQYSTVNCTGVYTYYKDYRPRCTQHGHSGNISVVDAIKWSCNIFFYDVGRRLTSDVYDAYAYKLGLAQRTGVEVSESLGRLTTKNDSNYNTSLDIQAAIGQGNTVVTPIQLATYAATLANNGVRYRTHFVKAILDTNTGEVIHETQPEVMDVVEDNGTTFALVRQGMKLVPSTITGKISSYPIAIACKTGTPQRSETYAPGKHYLNAMMIAYLPADDPEIAIGITVEYGGYGARTGDLVVDIANAYFAMKDGTLEVDPYVNPALSADPSDDTTGAADTTDTAGAAQDETQPEQGSAD